MLNLKLILNKYLLKCSPISNGSGSIPGNKYGCPIAFLNCIIIFIKLVLFPVSLEPNIAKNDENYFHILFIKFLTSIFC